MQISKYITLDKVEYSTTAIRKGISNKLPSEYIENAKYVAELYDTIYDHFNGNIRFNSFYRCIKLNKAIGGSGTSQHCLAEAIDIEGINGVKNRDIFDFCKTLDFDQLIDEFQDSNGEPNWVHISRRKGRNRKQVLKAIKNKKETIYLPI